MKLFSKLLQEINNFDSSEPIALESELEQKLVDHLKKNKDMIIERQVSKRKDRYDIICKSESETVCIELKILVKTSDIKQFDRYLEKFRDGFIIVCWQSGFSVKDLFQSVRDQSPIPIEMIELAKRYF